jgi:hypothetical protein
LVQQVAECCDVWHPPSSPSGHPGRIVVSAVAPRLVLATLAHATALHVLTCGDASSGGNGNGHGGGNGNGNGNGNGHNGGASGLGSGRHLSGGGGGSNTASSGGGAEPASSRKRVRDSQASLNP